MLGAYRGHPNVGENRYHNPASGALVTFSQTGQQVVAHLDLPMSKVLLTEAVQFLKDLSLRFSIPPTEPFQNLNTHNRTAWAALLAQNPKPPPPRLAAIAAQAWWDFTWDQPAFHQRIGGEAAIHPITLARNGEDTRLLRLLPWDGASPALFPEVDFIDLTRETKNFLGKSTGAQQGFVPWASFFSLLQEDITPVGAPYPLYFLTPNKTAQAAKKAKRLSLETAFQSLLPVPPGQFLDLDDL